MMPSVVVRGALGILVVALLGGCGQTVQHAAGSQVLPVADVQAPPTTVAITEARTAPATEPGTAAGAATAQPAPSAEAVDPSPTQEPEPRGSRRPRKPSEAPKDPGAALWDRSFVSTAVVEDGQPRPMVRNKPLTLRFEERADGVVAAWQSACNTTGGDVVATATHLAITDLMGTAMGCEEQALEQDDWINDFFRADPRWELDGDRLTLAAGDVVIRLRDND